MAETAAMIGHGSRFEVSTDDGATWDEIAEVYDLTPPSDQIDVVDATHMQSPNATREFILGLNDPGECTMEMNFVPGSTADMALQAIKAARERIRARITFPNLQRWTFSGILTGYEPNAPTDDRMTATLTFKVTGSYSIDEASS